MAAQPHHFIPARPLPAAPPRREDPGIAVRQVALQLVTDLQSVARRLERLGLADHAGPTRRLADLVAGEFCALALDDPEPRQAPAQPHYSLAAE